MEDNTSLQSPEAAAGGTDASRGAESLASPQKKSKVTRTVTNLSDLTPTVLPKEDEVMEEVQASSNAPQPCRFCDTTRVVYGITREHAVERASLGHKGPLPCTCGPVKQGPVLMAMTNCPTCAALDLFVVEFEEEFAKDDSIERVEYSPFSVPFIQAGLDEKVPYDETLAEPLIAELRLESSGLEAAIRTATSEQLLNTIRARAHRVAADMDRITEAQSRGFYLIPGRVIRTIPPFREMIMVPPMGSDGRWSRYASAIEQRAHHCGVRTVFGHDKPQPLYCPHKEYFSEFPCTCAVQDVVGYDLKISLSPLRVTAKECLDVTLPVLRDHTFLSPQYSDLYHSTLAQEAVGKAKIRSRHLNLVIAAGNRLRLSPRLPPAWMLHAVFSQLSTETLKKASALCQVPPSRMRDINAYPAIFRDAILMRDDATGYIENDLEKELKTKAFLPVSYADILADKKVKVGYPKIVDPKEPGGLPSLEGAISVSYIPVLYREEADTIARKSGQDAELLRKYMSVNRDLFMDLLAYKGAVLTDLEFMRKEDSIDAFFARRNALPKGPYVNLPEDSREGLIIRDWVRKFMRATAVDRSFNPSNGKPVTKTLSIEEKVTLIANRVISERNWESRLPSASRPQQRSTAQNYPQRGRDNNRGRRGRGNSRGSENANRTRGGTQRSGRENRSPGPTCWNCNQEGHRSARCPQLLRSGYASENK